MVLPYKHTRYQTALNNTCDDSSSATPDPSTCENQWAHAYNVMVRAGKGSACTSHRLTGACHVCQDMTTQAWASGRWEDVKCAGACLQTAGDYVTEGRSGGGNWACLPCI